MTAIKHNFRITKNGYLLLQTLCKKKKKEGWNLHSTERHLQLLEMFQRSGFAWQHIQLIMTHTNRHWHLNSNSVDLIPLTGTRGVSLAHVRKISLSLGRGNRASYALHLARLATYRAAL